MTRTIIKSTLVLFVILGVAYVLLLLVVNSARFNAWISAEIANRTGYNVSARDIRLDPLLRLILTEVSVTKAGNPVLTAERALVVPTPMIVVAPSFHRLQLQKPVFRLDLAELLEPTEKEPAPVRIRHVAIRDGSLFLSVGKGNQIAFQSIVMDAENVNVGEDIGVRLNTAVPWLNGTASIAVGGTPRDLEVTLQIDQKSQRGKVDQNQPTQGEALEGRIKLSRMEDGPLQINAHGILDGLRIADEKISGEINATAEITADHKKAVFSADAVTREAPAKLLLLPPALAAESLALSLRGDYDLENKNLYLRSLELRSPLGQANGHGKVSFTPAPRLNKVKLKLSDVRLDKLTPLLPSPLNTMVHGGNVDADLTIDGPWNSTSVEGAGRVSRTKLENDRFSIAEVNIETPIRWADGSFRAPDIRLSGRRLFIARKNNIEISAESLRLNGSLEKKPDAATRITGTLRVDRGAFASADGSKVGERLALQARFASAGLVEGKEISLDGRVHIEQGEILWGKFYGNFQSRRPTLELNGEYRSDSDLLRLRRASLALGSIGQIAIHGQLEGVSKNPVLRVDFKSDGIQSGEFFEFFIRETLNRSYPILDRLKVAGLVRLSAQASGALDQLAVEGALTLRNGDLRAKSNTWHVDGIAIDLPFRIGDPEAISKDSPPVVANGTVTIGSIKLGNEVVPAIKATVSLWNNVLRFHETLRVPIFGGSLQFSQLVWKDIIASPQAVSLAVTAKNLQLKRLTEELDWYRFGGTLSGSIEKIEWTGQSLRSEGQIDIVVFGGHLKINQLEVENPFSSLPSVKLDARFFDIQLEQASQTFEFGKISGVLAGTVNNLVMTKSQPSMFNATIYSVDKSGVSQRISIESLNKITVLSSGRDGGTLYGGLAGFFDSFRYSKLGFKATLRNDKLTLRGVESRDGKEYLVVGSFIPPTVNVISHTQEIAFAELMQRLERIQKSETPQKTTP